MAVFLITVFLSIPEALADYDRKDKTEEIIKLVSVLDEVIKAFE